MNEQIWCEHHQVFHETSLIDKFQRFEVPNGWCPIGLMESGQGVFVLEPTYTILGKPCTNVNWPQNIDLMVTKLPSTAKEGYSRGLVGYVANRAYSNMNNDSLAFVVMSSYKEEKKRPLMIIDIFEEAKFNYIDIIVLKKNKFIPIQGNKRLNNVYDFMFMFSKGDNYHLDRSSIIHLRGAGEDYICPGNLWDIKVDDKDSISSELVNDIISLSNLLPNSLIADPFGGTGATLQAALNNKHSYWGCELDKTKYQKMQKVVRSYREE
jgi:hypothetical protein